MGKGSETQSTGPNRPCREPNVGFHRPCKISSSRACVFSEDVCDQSTSDRSTGVFPSSFRFSFALFPVPPCGRNTLAPSHTSVHLKLSVMPLVHIASQALAPIADQVRLAAVPLTPALVSCYSFVAGPGFPGPHKEKKDTR